MKFIPGAVPFGPMSVDVVAPIGAVVVTVVSVVSTDEDYVGLIPQLCSCDQRVGLRFAIWPESYARIFL